MFRRKLVTICCVGAGIVLGTKVGAGCDRNCQGPSDFVDTGDSTVVEVRGEPGMEWAVGAEVHVDVDAGLMTIRYTREGTTYEVRYVERPS